MNIPDELCNGEAANAARCIIELVRKNSSMEVGDAHLCALLLVAAGICRSRAAFPSIADARSESASDGALFSAGVQIGFRDRINLEKESCEGTT
jgi:hypothetical protein